MAVRHWSKVTAGRWHVEDLGKATAESYARTIEQLKEARKMITDKADRTLLDGMISNCEYVEEWLETGRRPGNKRGVERLAAYQREIPTDLIEKYMQPVEYLPRGKSTRYKYSNDEVAFMYYMLSMLTDREAECYTMHIGGQYSMRDIADLLDLDVSTIHETMKRAERKIKAAVNRGIPLFLDNIV